MIKKKYYFVQDIFVYLVLLISMIIITNQYIYVGIFCIAGLVMCLCNFFIEKDINNNISQKLDKYNFLATYFYELLSKSNYEIAFNKAFSYIRPYLKNLNIEEIKSNIDKISFLNFGMYFKYLKDSFERKIDATVIFEIVKRVNYDKNIIVKELYKENKGNTLLRYGIVVFVLVLSFCIGIFGTFLLDNDILAIIEMCAFLFLLEIPTFNMFIVTRGFVK